MCKMEILSKIVGINKSRFDNSKLMLDFVKKEYFPKKNLVFKEYDLNHDEKFSIFESVSEKYRNETFHSDILFSLLSPDTPEIGMVRNKEILKQFISLMNEENEENKFIVDSSIQIKKESYNFVFEGKNKRRGYMDLLITNEHNQAIIIENKINNAKDRPDQLVRYLKYVYENICGKSFDGIFIMYLTLIPGKIPEIESGNNKYKFYKQKLLDAKNGTNGEILKYCSAINSNDEEKSLRYFLKKSIEILNKDLVGNAVDKQKKIINLKITFFEQYKTLLEHLGGIMTIAEYDKKVANEILTSKENFEAVDQLVRVFKSDDIIDFSITSSLNLLGKYGFKFKPDEGSGGWYYPDATDSFYYMCGGKRKLEVGFGIKGEIKDSEADAYLEILKRYFDVQPEDPSYDENIDLTWIYLRIPLFRNGNSMQEFLSYYTKNTQKIIEEFNKLSE